jgi:hypothetical protein
MKCPLLLALAAYGFGCAMTIGALPGDDVRDSTYSRGLVGLVSRFHPARFDNLAIALPPTE